MRFFALVTAAVSAACVVLAAPAESVSIREISNNAPYPALDLQCSKGYEYGYHTPIMYFDISSAKFMKAVGTFFHMEWYTGELTSHTGKDNTVGATRTGVYAGGSYTEKLTQYHHFGSDYLSMIWALVHPANFTQIPDAGPITFEKYTETLQVISICRGKAVEVHFPVHWCVQEAKEKYAYDFWFRAKAALVPFSLNTTAPIIPEGKCPKKSY